MSEINYKDQGEETISCGDCSKKLIHYRIYAPEVNTQQTIVCKCPFCSGHSFQKSIRGMFWYGPIDNAESNYPTQVLDIELSGNIWYVDVRKNGTY